MENLFRICGFRLETSVLSGKSSSRQRFPCFGHGLLPLSPVFEDPQIHEKGRRGALSPGSAIVAPKDMVGGRDSVEYGWIPGWNPSPSHTQSQPAAQAPGCELGLHSSAWTCQPMIQVKTQRFLLKPSAWGSPASNPGPERIWKTRPRPAPRPPRSWASLGN